MVTLVVSVPFLIRDRLRSLYMCKQGVTYFQKQATRFANPEAIMDNQLGVTELLKNFHLQNKGGLPFCLAQDPLRAEELAMAANLDVEQVQFVAQTVQWAAERGMTTAPLVLRQKKSRTD